MRFDACCRLTWSACWTFSSGKIRSSPMNSPCIKPDWPAPANVVAFTTLRGGGHSAAPYASLNLADHVADDPAAVRANRAVLATCCRPLPAYTG